MPGTELPTGAPPTRTIAVKVATPASYGPMRRLPQYQFPPKQPRERLDYALDLRATMAAVNDFIGTVSVSASPSNTPGVSPQVRANYTAALFGWPINSYAQAWQPYEATPFLARAIDNVVILWMQDGVPGRNGLIKVSVQTRGGRTFEFLVGLPIAATLQAGCPEPPVSVFFSRAVAWRNPRMDFSRGSNSSLLSFP